MKTKSTPSKLKLHIKPAEFKQRVTKWFKLHGRKDLPWQQNPTPYRVWISEIMLQQTQVNTVIPYYLKFMEKFATLESLAKATDDEVMALWSGLGYYSRARNLHKTALLISNDLNSLPEDLDDLVALPGIGKSTAGAILALSMDKKAAILDGNVKRVLARYFQISGWPGEAGVLKKLWQLAEILTPDFSVKDHSVKNYTQAMMDLGATICTRSKPACTSCPLSQSCLANKDGDQLNYPGKKKKKILPIKQQNYYLITNDNSEILMEKRPNTGIWGGLWTPLSCAQDIHANGNKADGFLLEEFGIKISDPARLPEFRHTFSHFHLQITPIKAKLKGFTGIHETKLSWDSIENWLERGIPAAVRTMLLQYKDLN